MDSNKYGSETKADKALVKQTYSILFNSDPAVAEPLNPLTFNNRYNVVLNDGIGVPKHAKGIRVAMTQSSYWNFDLNIKEGENKIYFEYDGNPQTSITITPGYYGLEDLKSSISLELNLAGEPTDLFTLTADAPSQKVIINFNAINIRLDFTQPDTLREIIGFDSRLSPTIGFAQAGEVDLGDNIAKFNSFNLILISMPTLLKQGIPVNAVGKAILGSIPITAKPNSLITYSPSYPIWSDANHLAGSNITNIIFESTNENLQPLYVVDSYSFILSIEYYA